MVRTIVSTGGDRDKAGTDMISGANFALVPHVHPFGVSKLEATFESFFSNTFPERNHEWNGWSGRVSTPSYLASILVEAKLLI